MQPGAYKRDDHTWVYNTYQQWHQQFPFLSIITIKRAMIALEKQGLLETAQFDLQKGDARKYYTIHYSHLNALLESHPSDQIDPTHSINEIPPSYQDDTTLVSKRYHLIGTETTTETTTERIPTAPKSARQPDPFYAYFQQAYENSYHCPYQNKKADFVQLANWKKQQGEWATLEHWQQAVDHYFASDLGNHTLADLSTRVGAFFRAALDRYGKPIGVTNGTDSRQPESTADVFNALRAKLRGAQNGAGAQLPAGSEEPKRLSGRQEPKSNSVRGFNLVPRSV